MRGKTQQEREFLSESQAAHSSCTTSPNHKPHTPLGHPRRVRADHTQAHPGFRVWRAGGKGHVTLQTSTGSPLSSGVAKASCAERQFLTLIGREIIKRQMDTRPLTPNNNVLSAGFLGNLERVMGYDLFPQH